VLPGGKVRLALAGGEVGAPAVRPPSVGETVCLSLRPERIRPLATGEDAENRIETQLVEIVYFGDHVRLKCRLPNGEPLTVKHSNDGRLRDPGPGATVALGWRIADARALPVNGEEPA
jgi:putative spermidine/putrescine transport system ATP-binding protein